MSRIYTGVGDGGTTRLADGSEVSKAHPRLSACGTLDELNSQLGVVRSVNADDEVSRVVTRIQSLLFEAGADLARPERAEARITDEDVRWLETEIDKAMKETAPLRSFVLPGETPAASHLHVARAVCRRAEREIVALAAVETVDPVLRRFMNRLSDLLFALARLSNERAGVREVIWKPRSA